MLSDYEDEHILDDRQEFDDEIVISEGFGMSFEEQLRLLNEKSANNLKDQLNQLDEELYATIPSRKPEPERNINMLRDGLSYALSYPASISEWRTNRHHFKIYGEAMSIEEQQHGVYEEEYEVETILEDHADDVDKKREMILNHLVEEIFTKLQHSKANAKTT